MMLGCALAFEQVIKVTLLSYGCETVFYSIFHRYTTVKKFGVDKILMFLKKASSAHYNIYLIKNTCKITNIVKNVYNSK